MVQELAASDGRHARVMGNPIVLADAAAAEARFAPRLGENTAEVLGELLGVSSAEINNLAAKGVVKA
jgi:crotonobetainyl-CoA:carnitine CoA-transferase CaiB-like acyl-CoA transferase